jgi:predicted transcriptional regulator
VKNINMSGKTVSAYTSSQTAKKLSEIAKRECRKKANLAGMAIELFVSLPPAAREAWLRIVANGEEELKAEIESKIARIFIDARYQITQSQVLEEMDIEHLEPLENEDDILTAAVSLTHQ